MQETQNSCLASHLVMITQFEMGFVCVCEPFWEHWVLLFLSWSEVWLFLAVLSQEPLAWFNSLFFLPDFTCMHEHLPAVLSVGVALFLQQKLRDVSQEVRADTFSLWHTNTIQFAWHYFPDLWMKAVQLGKKRGSFFLFSLSVSGAQERSFYFQVEN